MPQGRWPPNLLLSHSVLCGEECHPSCPVGILDGQAGPSEPRPVKPENLKKSGDGTSKGLFGLGSKVQTGYYDTSNKVSRFFPTFHPLEVQVKENSLQVPSAVVLEGDCLEVLRGMESDSVDALVTDPPAGISFMNKSWDSNKGSRNAWIAWLTEIMEEVLRVLKPGAHGLVWALPRTSHWTAMALEDAGFEVRDRIAHHFGSGFPKSANVSKHIDRIGGKNISWFAPWLKAERKKRRLTTKDLAEHFRTAPERINHGGCVSNWEQGLNVPTPEQFNKLCDILDLPFERIEEAKREVLGKSDELLGRKSGIGNETNGHYTVGGTKAEAYDITTDATDEAKRWSGWGTALKPSTEDWWLIRKPLSESSVAINVLKWNTGALNIDQSRVSTSDNLNGGGYSEGAPTGMWRKGAGGGIGRLPGEYEQPSGRWPSNLLLSHHPGCRPTGEMKRVKPGNGSGTASRRNASSIYGNDLEPGGDAVGFVDPDGTEEVAEWICVEPRIERRPHVEYAGATLDVLGASRPALSAYIRLLASELRQIVDSEGSERPSPYVPENEQADLELLDSQGCCSACCRLYDEHVRKIQEAAQASAPQLADALESVLCLESKSLRSHSCLPDALSTLGDSRPDAPRPYKPENSTLDAHSSSCGSSPGELESDKSDMASPERKYASPHGNTHGSNTSAPGDTTPSTLCRNTGTCEVFRPLVSVALALLPRFLPVTVSVHELYHAGCPVFLMDQMSGQKPPSFRKSRTTDPQGVTWGLNRTDGASFGHHDSGGASRFFQQFHPDTHPGFQYVPKSSRRERNLGLEGMPEGDRPLGISQWKAQTNGSGNEMGPSAPQSNSHPTVKSLALCDYLVRLITPPGGTCLDPFAGSGSTGCSAVRQGFNFIGIEKEPEYVILARKRIMYWSQPEEVRARDKGKPLPKQGHQGYNRKTDVERRCPEHGESIPSGSTTYKCGCEKVWYKTNGKPEPVQSSNQVETLTTLF